MERKKKNRLSNRRGGTPPQAANNSTHEHEKNMNSRKKAEPELVHGHTGRTGHLPAGRSRNWNSCVATQAEKQNKPNKSHAGAPCILPYSEYAVSIECILLLADTDSVTVVVVE